MGPTRDLHITLPLDLADLVAARVSSGDYASESDVIKDGLQALQEREAAIENWLRTDVAAAYDAHKANPHEALGLDEAWADLQSRLDDIDRDAL